MAWDGLDEWLQPPKQASKIATVRKAIDFFIISFPGEDD